MSKLIFFKHFLNVLPILLLNHFLYIDKPNIICMYSYKLYLHINYIYISIQVIIYKQLICKHIIKMVYLYRLVMNHLIFKLTLASNLVFLFNKKTEAPKNFGFK